MTHRLIGNIFATIMAVFTGVAVMYISVKYLREPQIALDWAVMVFSGIITGIFMFFLVWGHFQDPSVIAVDGVQVRLIEDTLCPKCGGHADRYHPVWTVICAVVFFPVGLVALFLWRRRCPVCYTTFPRRVIAERPKIGA